MAKRRIDRFPHGWCIRRADGTIATIQRIKGLKPAAAYRLAEQKAGWMDLSALPSTRHRKPSLGKIPKVQFNIRRRFRGHDKSLARQWSIYLSFILPLCSVIEGGKRKIRWSRVGVGSLDQLSQTKVNQAWRRVYGVWAWSTSLKGTVENQVIFHMEIPENTDSYLDLIDYPNPHLSLNCGGALATKKYLGQTSWQGRTRGLAAYDLQTSRYGFAPRARNS